MRRMAAGLLVAGFIWMVPAPAEAWKCHRHPEKPDCTTTTTEPWEEDWEDECPCWREDDPVTTTTTTNIPSTTTTVIAAPTTSTTVVTIIIDDPVVITRPPQSIPEPVVHQDPPPEVLPERLEKLPVTGMPWLPFAGTALAFGGAFVIAGARRP